MTLPIIPRGPDPVDLRPEFLKFVCPPTTGGGPFDPQPPTRLISRALDTKIDIPLPASVKAVTRAGKDKVRAWIIEDPKDPDGKKFPSPIIRTVHGDVVWADVGFALNTHTIHWHGIEPTAVNDGVGHTSFEVSGNFKYQFATNSPGTFFYHCHKNTVLHFEMGLYGLLVVDPLHPGTRADIPPAPYPTGGPGFVATNAPEFPGFVPESFVVPYDVEALWVADEFDSVWHDLGHNAFMQKCDPNNPNASGNFTHNGILNNHVPDIFTISGIFPEVIKGDLNNLPIVTEPILDAPVAATVKVGQTLLVRLLNAGYTTQEYRIGRLGDPIDATVIATDGHAFGVPGTRNGYSSPFVIPAGTPFRLTTARRIEMLFRPSTPGRYPVMVRHYDWVKSQSAARPAQRLLWGITRTVINVVA